jgi:transposase
MSAFYSFSGFDDSKFENLNSPSRDDLYNCLDNSDLLDKDIESLVGVERIIFSQDKEHREGLIDHLILLFQEKGPLNNVEKTVLEFLKKISEHYGNLVEKYAQEDPYFFGYLTSLETIKLQKYLSEISFKESEDNIERDLLQKVLKSVIVKKSGLIYSVI